jgi:hypothetical protein
MEAFHEHSGIISIYLCWSLLDPEKVVAFGKMD